LCFLWKKIDPLNGFNLIISTNKILTDLYFDQQFLVPTFFSRAALMAKAGTYFINNRKEKQLPRSDI